jgi:hypothetical protein
VHLWGQADEGDVDNHEREVSGEDIEKGRERERKGESATDGHAAEKDPLAP